MLFTRMVQKKIQTVLPMSLLIFMDAVTLAHWIMCDGYNESNCGLVLCTDNFTMQEVCALIGLLHYNFGFVCTFKRISSQPKKVTI